MKIIPRDTYLDKMIRVINTPDIKVITGVRRAGKSKLLELFKEYINNTVDNANIIHINYNKKVGKSGVMWGIVSNFVAEFQF